MPVGVESLDVKKQVGIPNGASPTGEYAELPTDEENVDSDNEASKGTKNKGLAVPKNDDDGGITDSEDCNFSGNEDEFFQEKVKNRPTLQELGILDENPHTETINLTEGYAQAEGHHSASEDENDERMHIRHKKNIKTMKRCEEMLGVPHDADEGTTDVEDMDGEGDEIEYRFKGDDSLPAHYMEKDDGTIESKEKMTQVMAVPKAIPRVMVKHTPASSDDDEDQPKQHKRRPKGRSQLAVATASGDESGHTDVEDLHMGGPVAPQIKITGGGETQGPTKSVSSGRIKKRKQKKSKQQQVKSSSLITPAGDEDGVTDVEELSGIGSNTESDSDLDADIYGSTHYGLTAPMMREDGMTDAEDFDASDDEGLIAPPIKKAEPFVLPEVHQTIEHIKDIQDKPKEEKGKDTDDEDFELDDKEDNKPLAARKTTEVREIKKIFLEPDDDGDEGALTDMEDMDMDEKAENELLEDYISRVPIETEILPFLKEMEESCGNVSKTEAIRDLNIADTTDPFSHLSLQEALIETLTDVEDLDDDVKPKEQQKKKKTKKQRKNEGTDEESMNESDFEDEPHAAPSKKKRGRGRGKRLPLVSQLSEVRFVETKTGPLSIIVTPDIREKNPGNIIQDKVSGVMFVQEEEEGAFTDFEELSGDEDKSKKSKKSMKVPRDDQNPLTDTEDFEGEIGDLERPATPLPTEKEYSVLRSPKRELIRIKEDKHGVPQVTIEKLTDNMLAVSDVEDMGLTDTEDIDATEAEAEQYMGAHIKRAEFKYEFPDCGTIEYKSRNIKKKQAKSGLNVDSGNDEGHTDVEELSMPKKGRKKNRSRSKLVPSEDTDGGHTDIEYLDAKDRSSLTIKVSAASDNEEFTDMDDLDAGTDEDIHPSREDCATPDVIRKAAIKKIMKIKEGPHGITKTEHSEIAPDCGLSVPDDEIEGVTDTSDMEHSGGEEEEIKRPEVDLPEHYSSVITTTSKSRDLGKGCESKDTKDNLLPPEDDKECLTDVESCGEGEGNRDP